MSSLRWSGQSSHENADITLFRAHLRSPVALATQAFLVQDYPHERTDRQAQTKSTEHTDSPGILRNAYLKEVPVFIPAFTDSELGLDLAGYMVRQALAQGRQISDALGTPSLQFNPFLDLGAYAQKALAAKKLGIFTVGGGVPRNWAQQVAPYLDLLQMRLGLELPEVRFHYGVRLCPEPAHWGGLSGCTFKEGVSWGKFVSPEDGGKFAEVLCDATIVWPILLKGISQRLDKPRTAGPGIATG